MWPATPSNPSLAFHQDLLLWMEALLLEGCIGVDAFCRAVTHKVGKRVSQQVVYIVDLIIGNHSLFFHTVPQYLSCFH